MSDLEPALRDLVIANRILANEGVVDAYGHISIRHPERPDRFFLSCSRSPELVVRDDIMEFELDGTPVGNDKRQPYLERFIHGAIYEKQANTQSVVHSHATAVLPFAITGVPLRPVIHTAFAIGAHIPVWDIEDRFGDTNLLVVNQPQGRDLAQTLGTDRVVLMRGHGFSAAGRSIVEAVMMSVYMPINAQVMLDALRIGTPKGLTAGEIAHKMSASPAAPERWRAWEYWAKRAGCGDMLTKKD